MAAYKQKTFKLAQDNGLVIFHQKTTGMHIALVSLTDGNMRFCGFSDDDIELDLRGVDGFYNNPDWKEAYEFISFLIEEGFYKL